jgi:hypothetical protein
MLIQAQGTKWFNLVVSLAILENSEALVNTNYAYFDVLFDFATLLLSLFTTNAPVWIETCPVSKGFELKYVQYAIHDYTTPQFILYHNKYFTTFH